MSNPSVQANEFVLAAKPFRILSGAMHYLGIVPEYWEVGPQRTLYVPAPLLRKGRNELVVFELHGAKAATAEFRGRHEPG